MSCLRTSGLLLGAAAVAMAMATVSSLAGCGERGAGRAAGDAGTFTLPPLGLEDAGTGPTADDLDTASGRVRRARADLERVLALGRPAEGKLACELGLATSADLAGQGAAAAPRDKLAELCVQRIYPAALRADLARIKAAAAAVQGQATDDVAFHCDKDRAMHDAVAAAGREADLVAAFAAACKQRW